MKPSNCVKPNVVYDEVFWSLYQIVPGEYIVLRLKCVVLGDFRYGNILSHYTLHVFSL